MKYEYITLQIKNGSYNAYGWGTYSESSVLAGQASKTFIDSFDTQEEAEEAYPDAQWSNAHLEPQISYNHLPIDDY